MITHPRGILLIHPWPCPEGVYETYIVYDYRLASNDVIRHGGLVGGEEGAGMNTPQAATQEPRAQTQRAEEINHQHLHLLL